MKTILVIEVEHAKPLPDDFPKLVEGRVYGIGSGLVQDCNVKQQLIDLPVVDLLTKELRNMK